MNALISIGLETVTCANCYVIFGAPERLIKDRRADGLSFYCPNGHKNYYTTTTLDRLKKELEREKSDKAYFAGRADELAKENAGLSKNLKTVKTKFKNQTTRIAAGVCPKCNRTFQQLARHMQNKHPDQCKGHK